MPAGLANSVPMAPREHGAWAMVLSPFAAALILARAVTWASLPALAAVVAVFALREPLVYLARERWVWRTPRVDREIARRSLLCWLLLLATSAIHLFSILPWRFVAGLGAIAGLFTLMSVYMAVSNRQRSVALQVISVLGLNSSAFAAWLSVRTDFPAAIWWLWGLLSAHCIAAVLVVHARLAARAAARTAVAEAARFRRDALAAQWLLLAGAAASMATPQTLAGVPLAFSGAVHLGELKRLSYPATLEIPLRKVGWRAVAVSVAFTVLTLIVLRL